MKRRNKWSSFYGSVSTTTIAEPVAVPKSAVRAVTPGLTLTTVAVCPSVVREKAMLVSDMVHSAAYGCALPAESLAVTLTVWLAPSVEKKRLSALNSTVATGGNGSEHAHSGSSHERTVATNRPKPRRVRVTTMPCCYSKAPTSFHCPQRWMRPGDWLPRFHKPRKTVVGPYVLFGSFWGSVGPVIYRRKAIKRSGSDPKTQCCLLPTVYCVVGGTRFELVTSTMST